MIKPPLQDNKPSFVPDALSFIPLGGAGEFGCNMNVYHCDGKFLIVDCGIGFPDERFPGVDTLLPDPAFLRQCKDDIVGLVITHAHDDHKGAIAALWPQLNCPIYATPFVAELLRHQLREWDLEKRIPLHEVALGSTFKLGPFDIELINTAHSVVESSMLYIKTPHGNVLHTGDWRIDDNPIEGASTDATRLKELGNEKVLALVGDSTNSDVQDRHPSEAELEGPLADLFSSSPGRVIVTMFSHSIPRMRSVTKAAKRAGRVAGITGRSMLKVYEAAQKTGYLNGMPQLLNDSDIASMPPKKAVIFATGSQGEPGSAMDRISKDEHRSISLESGDIVIFSAREIPGNEKAIERIRNALLSRGVKTIMPEDRFVHASGHAYRAEIKELLEWVKPLAVLPVHGGEEQQLSHVEIAKEVGITHNLIPRNGDIIALRETGPELTGTLQTGLMAIDGVRVVPMRDSMLLKERHRIANDGNIVVTVVADEQGYLLHDPILAIAGLSSDEEDLIELEDVLINDIDDAVRKLSATDRMDAETLREAVRLAIRRRVKMELGKRPLLNVHLVQVK
jgi:ribonuclease J